MIADMVKMELAPKNSLYLSSVWTTAFYGRCTRYHIYKLTLFYMQAKQNCCTKRKQNLTGRLNIFPSVWAPDQSAKRNIEPMEKWIKEQSVTTVHVWRFSWAWASSSRIVGIKCAARRSRHRGCQGHRASSLWLWFLSQDTECSDGSGLCRQGQADNENQR